MSKTIYAIVTEPMITINSGRRIACFQNSGPESGHCGHCGREFNYTTDNRGMDICGLACSWECLKSIESRFFTPVIERAVAVEIDDIPGDVETVEVETPKIEKVDRPLTCPGCDGPRYKRGYRHTDDCSARPGVYVPKNVGKVCPKCGGEARGRGFSHKDGCEAKSVSVYTPSGNTCSECGGSARGRGFAHKDGCKVVADLKAKYGAKYASK